MIRYGLLSFLGTMWGSGRLRSRPMVADFWADAWGPENIPHRSDSMFELAMMTVIAFRPFSPYREQIGQTIDI